MDEELWSEARAASEPLIDAEHEACQESVEAPSDS
jgi:hypothetical protein